jgi:hypothetical protein
MFAPITRPTKIQDSFTHPTQPGGHGFDENREVVHDRVNECYGDLSTI